MSNIGPASSLQANWYEESPPESLNPESRQKIKNWDRRKGQSIEGSELQGYSTPRELFDKAIVSSEGLPTNGPGRRDRKPLNPRGL